MTIEYKHCGGCDRTLPVSDFHRNRRLPHGIQTQCKTCMIAYSSRYQKEHPESVRRNSRVAKMRAKYGLPKEEAKAWVDSGQCGPCECCGSVGKLVIDHDHTTGALRGKLCQHCNSVIGFARDSEVVLAKAIEYLRSHK